MSTRSPEQTATKDCPTCQKRRIKCDRGLPTCRKCGKRNFECPGYGLRLKWVEGPSSRGNVRGATPSPSSPATPTSPSSGALTEGAIAVRNSTDSTWQSHPTPSGLASERALSPASELGLSQARPLHVSRLVSWFNERVAHRLAWVPQQNAWRHMILPMAESSETVMSSILAIAAHDLATEYSPTDVGHGAFQQMSKNYQNRSLALLSQELNKLSTSPSTALEASTTSAHTLASVILLCNNEFMKPEQAGWRVHLSAAKQIILAAKGRPHRAHHLACIEEFLILEFYEASVWADLTTFKNYNYTPRAPPTAAENAVFTDYIRVIDQITRLERFKSYPELRQQHPPQCGPIQDIHAQIDAARDNMLRLSGAMHFSSEDDQRGFELVIQMYYHATIIYSYQALADSPTSYDVRASRDEIIRYVQFLSETRDGMFAQDLVWPLFTAGTELRGDPAGQQVIRQCFGNVMRISRILDRARVLEFLEAWWSEPAMYTTWIDLARTQSLASEYDILIV